MNDFWQNAITSDQPENAGADGAAYRAYQASKSGGNGSSGSRMYSAEYQAALMGQRAPRQPHGFYVDDVRDLSDYASAPAPSFFDQRGGETREAWRRRLTAVGGPELQNLPVEVREELAKPDEELDAEGRWQQHRASVDGHLAAGGSGGVQGTGTRGLGRGFSERSIEGHGHLAAGTSIAGAPRISTAEAYQLARERAEHDNPQRPIPPSSSSGQGWL